MSHGPEERGTGAPRFGYHRRVRNLLALVLALVAPLAAADHVVSVGGFGNTTVASFGSSPGQSGPTVGWLYTRGVLGVGAGLRAAAPSVVAPVPLEAYVRGVITIAIGPWEPLLGPELGISGLSGLARPLPMRPTDFTSAENSLTGLVYVAFHTEAARFRFGRVVLSLLGVDVGTSLTAAGTVLRLSLDYATVGVRW